MAVLKYSDASGNFKDNGNLIVKIDLTANVLRVLTVHHLTNQYPPSDKGLISIVNYYYYIPDNKNPLVTASNLYNKKLYEAYRVTWSNGAITKYSWTTNSHSQWGVNCMVYHNSYLYLGGALAQDSGTDVTKERPLIARVDSWSYMLTFGNPTWLHTVDILESDNYNN